MNHPEKMQEKVKKVRLILWDVFLQLIFTDPEAYVLDQYIYIKI